MKTNPSFRPPLPLSGSLASVLTATLTCWLSLTSFVLAGAAVGDNFDDNSKDTSKWGPDIQYGKGLLTETGGALQYTATPTSRFDEMDRVWILQRFPYTNDWEVQIEVVNLTQPLVSGQGCSFGMYVFNGADDQDLSGGEMYNFTGGSGFYSFLNENNSFVDSADTSDLGVTNGAVRIAFNSTTKVLTFFYDINPGNGYSWIQYASFGVNGSGGTTANAMWDMDDSGYFVVQMYGYSQDMTILSGELYGDNFLTTGGFTPSSSFDAAFSKVKDKCKTKENVTTCKFGASLSTTNSTFFDAASEHIRVFLSTNSTYDLGVDTLLQEFDTGVVKVGKSAKLKVKQTLGSSSAGLYLLAVAADDSVLTSFHVPIGP